MNLRCQRWYRHRDEKALAGEAEAYLECGKWGQGVWYLTDHCTPISDTVFRQRTCFRPAVIKSPFHATSSLRTAVGLFLLLRRRSGTHCPKICGIRSVLWTVTDSHWRHFYFPSTSVFSASEICYDNALYKFTFDIDKCSCVLADGMHSEWFQVLSRVRQLGLHCCSWSPENQLIKFGAV